MKGVSFVSPPFCQQLETLDLDCIYRKKERQQQNFHEMDELLFIHVSGCLNNIKPSCWYNVANFLFLFGLFATTTEKKKVN